MGIQDWRGLDSGSVESQDFARLVTCDDLIASRPEIGSRSGVQVGPKNLSFNADGNNCRCYSILCIIYVSCQLYSVWSTAVFPLLSIAYDTFII